MGCGEAVQIKKKKKKSPKSVVIKISIETYVNAIICGVVLCTCQKRNLHCYKYKKKNRSQTVSSDKKWFQYVQTNGTHVEQIMAL